MLSDIHASLPPVALEYLDLLDPQLQPLDSNDPEEIERYAMCCYDKMLDWLMKNRTWLWPPGSTATCLVKGHPRSGCRLTPVVEEVDKGRLRINPLPLVLLNIFPQQ